MRPEPTKAELELIRSIAMSINREIVRTVNDGGIFDDQGQPLATFAPGSQRDKKKCIIAGAVGKRVFPRFGFEAEPRPFEAVAISEKNRRAIRSMEDFGSAAAYQHVAQGAAPAGMWSGHLSLVINGMIVDPTAGQFTYIRKRPGPGEVLDSRDNEILIPDTVIIPAAETPADNTKFFAEFHSKDGGTLAYRYQPDNTGYQQLGYWTHDGANAEIARRVEADVRAEQHANRAPTVPLNSRGIHPPGFVFGNQGVSRLRRPAQ